MEGSGTCGWDIPIGSILSWYVLPVKTAPCLWEPMPRLLGEKLRYLRMQRQMTQVELAQQLGLARQGYVSNLEAGRKAPSLDLVVQIADLFGVTTDYLLRVMFVVGQREKVSIPVGVAVGSQGNHREMSRWLSRTY
jgi:DNA-binding XRE family transcriptional regulator